MAQKQSAGLLLYKLVDGEPLVYLVHPGGPFWAKRDAGAWSIPKGEFLAGEDPLAAARREFTEETGQIAEGRFDALAPCRQAGGKLVQAWAVEGDASESVTSNLFEMEWPPRSGRRESFPEVDRGGWFTLAEARTRINPGQIPLLEELAKLIAARRAAETRRS